MKTTILNITLQYKNVDFI